MICKKCNTHFSINLKLNGKTHNLGNRKYCLTCSPFKQHNTLKLHTTTQQLTIPTEKMCYACKIVKPFDQFYIKTGKQALTSSCISCQKESIKAQRKKLKELAVEYKGGACTVCGYNKCIKALEFHHIDPTKKEFTISSAGKYKMSQIQNELDKCILLCNRCHVELHDELYKTAPIGFEPMT